MRRHRPITALLASLSSLTIALSLGGAAQAAEVDADYDPIIPMACYDMGWHYSTFSRQDIHIPTRTHFKSGPGGTVTSSIESGHSASTSVSLGTTFEVSSIVARAEATFGIDASVTSNRSQSYTYSHNITPGKYGHLQFGNWGYRMGVSKYYVNQNCAITTTYNGTVNQMPSANTWGFKYWETSY